MKICGCNLIKAFGLILLAIVLACSNGIDSEKIRIKRLNLNIEGGGTVTVEPDKEFYYEGEVVVLEIVDDLCWEFAGWSGALEGFNTKAIITISTDITITASFRSKCKIAFTRLMEGTEYRYDIYLMNVDGSEVQNLTNDEYIGSNYANPKWSPAGDKIAFLYVDYQLQSNRFLMIMETDGTNRDTIGYDCSSFTWSPDGNQIAFKGRRYSDSDNRWAYVYSLTNETYDSLLFGFSGFDWSPNGQYFVYSEDCHNIDYDCFGADLYMVNRHNWSDVHRITDTCCLNLMNPQWAPDGFRIAAYGSPYHYWAPAGIYIVTIEGNIIQYIGLTSRFSWSPDGNRCVISCGGGDKICILDINGTTSDVIYTSRGVRGTYVSWSPVLE